ncbi:cysteine hydrolase family protein [Campylobacter sp. LR291e]|uniref:cysteine hydrolase family protein n=1 Tax=Campylobacter sp. LR291e TaxID=2593546 RepID=UPI0012386933|nr:cysteine hydrolase family protein [Campylobacter sp. LR291e]KAA6233480.1 cysteine hydrolase family protein [Campylobacter sp. LR291e]
MKKALIVVDFQNDFINGSLGFEKAKRLEKVILQKLTNFKDDIIFTFDTHDDKYLQSKEGKNLPIKHCLINSPGWNMPENFTPFLKKAKKIFYKNTFGSLELANFLQDENYDELEFCGLVSHICVFANIILAHSASLNTKLILDLNATASFDDDLHNKTLDILRVFNVELIPLNQD